ncbi:prephenate dehydratase [Curvularia kusanoi]|uniref:prephenate dehydratase n=1 Tax=Curvularia kusanoi TaxID=90978 RepID=A0A9P4W8W4_CURKU|nr:prephenate dehydratase [Curvularia kusanoi]
MPESANPKVAFLGPEASYTHQAALDTFSPDKYTLAPQTTIEDVFAAVQDGSVHRGVVPFENSTNGSVVFTLDLFADLHSKYNDILVCGEAYVSVSHCLLGLDAAVSSDYSKIKKLYSHPQAWGQCKTFLQQHLKHAERFDVSSTSRAAQMVAESNDSSAAAISSKVAGTLFNLSLLSESINDVSGNQTRFLVLRRRDDSDDSSSTPAPSKKLKLTESPEEDYKTLLLFTLPYTPSNPNPGALAQCLSVFGRHKLNLTSINTRPSGVANWEYIFFIEFKGRKEKEESGSVNAAFKELSGVCEWYRWLGSWENRQPAPAPATQEL